jgi:hypothetical protein
MKDFFNCEEAKKYLFDVMDNEASSNIKEAFFKHIENCNSCMQLYKTHINIKNALRDDKIYLNEDFTQKVMNKIKKIDRKPFKTNIYRIMKITGPVIAAAACVLFVFAIINKGLLDKNLNTALDKATAPNKINDFAQPQQEAADENTIDSSLLENGDNAVAEESKIGLTALPPEETPEIAPNNDIAEPQPAASPEAAVKTAEENNVRNFTKTPSDANINFDAYKDNFNVTTEDNSKSSQGTAGSETENDTTENPAAYGITGMTADLPIFDYFLPILDEAHANANYKYTAIIHLYSSDKNAVLNKLSEKFNFVTQSGDTFYIYTTNDTFDKVREYFNIPKGEEASVKTDTKDELTNLNTVNTDVHMLIAEDNLFKNYNPSSETAMLFIRVYNEDYETYLKNNKQ